MEEQTAREGAMERDREGVRERERATDARTVGEKKREGGGPIRTERMKQAAARELIERMDGR